MAIKRRVIFIICVYTILTVFFLKRIYHSSTSDVATLSDTHNVFIKQIKEVDEVRIKENNVITDKVNGHIDEEEEGPEVRLLRANYTKVIHNDNTVESTSAKSDGRFSSQSLQNQTNKIILWYVKPRYIMPILEPKMINNCRWKCAITTNREYHNKSSALVFAAQIIKEDVPRRYGDQVFVLHNHEPQCAIPHSSYFRKPEWRSQFNWTMWYRFDSDIHEPYGIIKKRDIVPQKDYQEILKNKTKLAAWVVSNCGGQSRRMEYVKRLAKHVNVDVFGSCGNKSCSRGTDGECLDMIGQQYKFYLAFESSFCPEYITEKFFRYYRGDVILIARGGANYTKVIPRDTFIDTHDFTFIKDLASYLIHLDANDEEYISMLKRKDQYESIYEEYSHRNRRNEVTYATYHYEEQPFCDLCARLHNLEKYQSSYDNIGKWFDKKPCFRPEDLK